MIVLFVVLWIIAACICAGCLMHMEPHEWAYDDGARILAMVMSLFTWWVFLVIGLAYLVLKVLVIIPTFLSGILDGMKKEKEEKKDGNTSI